MKTRTFWGAPITVPLPAGADIYLTGGKTHSSERRLTKYLLLHLTTSAQVIDIGAHIGFYSMLAAEIASNGKVFAIEPASGSFKLLRKNVAPLDNCVPLNIAISEASKPVRFYEYDVLHSEYNTLEAEQFQNEEWHVASNVNSKLIQSDSLDDFCEENRIKPDFIKIDVEGGELKVLEGGRNILSRHNSTIVIEFVCAARKNINHIKAEKLLISLRYSSFVINELGELATVVDVERYLQNSKLESDNIVFKKV